MLKTICNRPDLVDHRPDKPPGLFRKNFTSL